MFQRLKRVLDRERILFAAIVIDDQSRINSSDGFTLTGYRHGDCYQIAKEIYKDEWEYYDKLSHDIREGFITSKGRFVGRCKAAKIAYRAGQTYSLLRTLHSEDLYK